MMESSNHAKIEWKRTRINRKGSLRRCALRTHCHVQYEVARAYYVFTAFLLQYNCAPCSNWHLEYFVFMKSFFMSQIMYFSIFPVFFPLDTGFATCVLRHDVNFLWHMNKMRSCGVVSDDSSLNIFAQYLIMLSNCYKDAVKFIEATRIFLPLTSIHRAVFSNGFSEPLGSSM